MNKVSHLDHSAFIVPAGAVIKLSDYDPGYTAGLKDKKEGKKALSKDISELAQAQSLLWASSQYSVLIILQAMDAAGKDGAIKHVMSGVNPQGVDVHSFKAPNDEERLHHFLWRPMRKLPARGRIAIFNRSYYEEVLVVRVHPEYLDSQYIPTAKRGLCNEDFWQSRFDDINHFEDMVLDSDTIVLKFFLNVSKGEQKERFLQRLNRPEKNWKFSAADLKERGYWDDYQRAFEEMLSATSTERSPWYVIPADNKWFARAAIADVVTKRIQDLNLQPPKPSQEQLDSLEVARKALEEE